MRKGFTLIELMIVISVIGILSAIMLSVINVNRTRARAQDAVKRQDISTIAGALERYYSDFNRYPNKNSYENTSSALTVLVTNYLKQLPVSPGGLANYRYKSYGSDQHYCLCFTSTVEVSDIIPTGCNDPTPTEVNICITNSF